MEDIKKPYECRHRGCSMSFVTKDRLDVHVRTHNLSLTLTPTTPFKTLIDQTPTPSRFLNPLENEVFINPFDATFREANSGNGASNSFINPEPSELISSLPDSDVLNTPCITLPPPTPLLLKTNFAKKKVEPEEPFAEDTTTDTLPPTPDTRHGEGVAEDGDLCLEDSSTFMSSESAFLDDEGGKTPSVQTPVITSIGSLHSLPLKSNTTGVPTAVVVTRPSTTPAQTFSPAPMCVGAETTSPSKSEPVQAIVQSMCVTPMVQVIIRLPDGQTMPVQFPVMSQVPPVAATPAPPVTATPAPVPSTAPVSHPSATPVVLAAPTWGAESQIPTSAKMKLKERLTTNPKFSAVPMSNSPQTKQRTKPPTILPNDDVLAEFGLSPPSSPIVHRPGHNGRKRREPSNNPDEKRRRSLERNRAAATRCREKKKVWITALEQKAEELENVNTNLQHEVSQLRNEVAQLKTMLLAHKDCPVTLQQKGMVYTERNAYTTIQVINHSAPDDLQRVPNSSLSTEYMEVELSSIQSSSDASLTSDTSEASFKER